MSRTLCSCLERQIQHARPTGPTPIAEGAFRVPKLPLRSRTGRAHANALMLEVFPRLPHSSLFAVVKVDRTHNHRGLTVRLGPPIASVSPTRLLPGVQNKAFESSVPLANGPTRRSE